MLGSRYCEKSGEIVDAGDVPDALRAYMSACGAPGAHAARKASCVVSRCKGLRDFGGVPGVPIELISILCCHAVSFVEASVDDGDKKDRGVIKTTARRRESTAACDRCNQMFRGTAQWMHGRDGHSYSISSNAAT